MKLINILLFSLLINYIVAKPLCSNCTFVKENPNDLYCKVNNTCWPTLYPTQKCIKGVKCITCETLQEQVDEAEFLISQDMVDTVDLNWLRKAKKKLKKKVVNNKG